MSYHIEPRTGYVEVHVSGQTSARELLEIVQILRDRDPRKQIPDLWMLEGDTMVPLSAFWTLAEGVRALCSPDLACSRTALVASGPMQAGLLDLYRAEAADLPFEIRIFTSRDEALGWLLGGKATGVNALCP